MATVRAVQTPFEANSTGPGLENSYRTPYATRTDGNRMGYSPVVPDSTVHRPASASPHQLDYDALDQENGPWVPDNDDATDAEMVYSDFNAIDSNKPVVPDDNDFFDPFQGTDLQLNHSDQAAQKVIWEKQGYGGGSGGGGGGSRLHYMP